MAGFQRCVLELPTLEVVWPVFSTPRTLALKLPPLAVLWPLFSLFKSGHTTSDLGSFMATFY